MNIDSVYSLVSRTGYPIFYRWSGRIRRMLNRYSLSVSIGQLDRISNIIWVVWLDQGNAMNIDSVYPLVSRTVYPILCGGPVGSGECQIDINLVYLLVSRTGYPILYGWFGWIRRMP